METPGQNSEEMDENLDYGESDAKPRSKFGEVDEQLQSDDQNAEDSSEVTADETSSIPVWKDFEPIETEDEPLQSDEQNAERLSEVTADETSSIPVLEGFEPIETRDEPLQSDDQNAEDFSEVTADETSSIPVLEGFEPIETEDDHHSLMTKIKKTLQRSLLDETSIHTCIGRI